MSEKWYYRRWKTRLGDVPPGRAFWLAGCEYAWWGWEASLKHSADWTVNGWEWETGKLALLDPEAVVFYFGENDADDVWRLAAYLVTRISHSEGATVENREVPESLRKLYDWLAPLLDGQTVVGWKEWVRTVMSSPRDYLEA